MRRIVYYNASKPSFRPFILTVDSGADARYTIPTFGGGYNYSVNTSDGQFFNGVTGNQLVIFPLANTLYDIEIRGLFPMIFINNNAERLKVRDVKQWGDVVWGSMDRAFWGCENLIISATDAPDLSSVTTMYYMLASCTSLTSLDVSNWDVSSVTNMVYVFGLCTSLTTLDVSNWNVSSVINMDSMFRDCQSLTTLDVSNWNVSSVTNMYRMFRDCQSLVTLDVSNWNVSDVVSFNEWLLFSGVQSNIDFSNPITGSISATNTTAMVSFTGVESLKLQASNVVNNPNINEYRDTGMYELILIGQKSPVDIRHVSSTLIGVAIDDLFTSLGTANSGATITITTAQSTSGIDTTIATAKGWTIIVV